MFLSQKDFSEFIGVHKATVSKFKKRREIVMHGNKVDVEKSMQLLRSIGKTFDKNNKLISSKTSHDSSSNIVKNDTNLLNTEFVYPALTQEERNEFNRNKAQEDLQKEASELGLDLKEISPEKIDSMEKWEVERFKIFFQGKIEEAKYLKEIGQLVSKDQVEEEQFLIARTIRDAFLSMSNRISHQLVGKTEIHEIKNIIDMEAHKVMENLSR